LVWNFQAINNFVQYTNILTSKEERAKKNGSEAELAGAAGLLEKVTRIVTARTEGVEKDVKDGLSEMIEKRNE
jgi:hypothetical protein